MTRLLLTRLTFVLAALLSWSVSACNHQADRTAKRSDKGSVVFEENTQTQADQLPQSKRSVSSPRVAGRSGDRPCPMAKGGDVQPLPSDHPIRKSWPRSILTGVISADGRTVAIHDSRGVFLTDQEGRSVRRVSITLLENLVNEEVTVSFVFRCDSRRLAILTRLSYGEPMASFMERLWTADAIRGRSRCLKEWSDMFQGPGPVIAERQIEDWTPDGKSIIVRGIIYVGDMPSEMHSAGTERSVIEDVPSKQPCGGAKAAVYGRADIVHGLGR